MLAVKRLQPETDDDDDGVVVVGAAGVTGVVLAASVLGSGVAGAASVGVCAAVLFASLGGVSHRVDDVVNTRMTRASALSVFNQARLLFRVAAWRRRHSM